MLFHFHSKKGIIFLVLIWIISTRMSRGDGQGTLSADSPCLCSNSSAMSGMCYVTFDEPMTYNDAITQCEIIGGSLAKLDPVDQVTDIIQEMAESRTRFWIGLDNIEGAGVYRWAVDNSSLNPHQSKFRSVNRDDLDCVGLDLAGNLQIVNCNDSHMATCDVSTCDGTCACHSEQYGDAVEVTQFGDRCILTLFRMRRTFRKQEDLCRVIGFTRSASRRGHLVQLEPLQEVKDIVLQQIRSRGGDRPLTWVGLSDILEEGRIRFTSNVSVTADSVNHDTDSRAFNCIVVDVESGLWDYARCSEEVPFVCQITECPVTPSAHSTSIHTTGLTMTTDAGLTKGLSLPDTDMRGVDLSLTVIVGVTASSILAVMVIAAVTLFLCCQVRSTKCSKESTDKRVEIMMSPDGNHNRHQITGSPVIPDDTSQIEYANGDVGLKTSVVPQFNPEDPTANRHHYYQEGGVGGATDLDGIKKDHNQLINDYEDLGSSEEYGDVEVPMVSHRDPGAHSESNQHYYQGGHSLEVNQDEELREDRPQLPEEYEELETAKALPVSKLLLKPQLPLNFHGSLRQPKQNRKDIRPWNSLRRLSPRTSMKWRKLPVPGDDSPGVQTDTQKQGSISKYSHFPTTDDVYYDVDQSEALRDPIYDDVPDVENGTEVTGTDVVYNVLYSDNEAAMIYNSTYDSMDSM